MPIFLHRFYRKIKKVLLQTRNKHSRGWTESFPRERSPTMYGLFHFKHLATATLAHLLQNLSEPQNPQLLDLTIKLCKFS